MKRKLLGLESSQVGLSMKANSVLCEVRSSSQCVLQINFSRRLSLPVHVRTVVNSVVNGQALFQII